MSLNEPILPVTDVAAVEAALDRWVDEHSDLLIASTQGVLRIPSVKGDPAPGAPFGVENLKALHFVLAVAGSLGLETKDLGGYAGHAEWVAPEVDADAPIVGVLAHLDVVPEGEGWRHPPYGAEIEDGILYGRGAIDDKGPAMAGLFAAAAVASVGGPLSHRIRVIFGCDEEDGFGCVDHYFAHEEMPEVGFTPDGEFPLIYAEKGIATYKLSGDFPAGTGPLVLTELKGGRRSNMVPDRAHAMLEGDAGALSACATRLAGFDDITVTALSETRLSIEARGISSHGSTPDLGRNAIAVLAEALLGSAELDERQKDVLTTVRRIAADTVGEVLGISGSDTLSVLSTNLGIAACREGHLILTVNVRYPVTWELAALTDRLVKEVAGLGLALAGTETMAPLYVPVDDPLVVTLLSVYRDATGDTTEPRVIGGGTYARAMRKGVAFGAAFAGRGGGAHEPDEHWAVADLLHATKIFARALYLLARQG